VAVGALVWGIFKSSGAVTSGACYGGMLPLQKESRGLVLKTDHPVLSIVALGASDPKIQDVLLDESAVLRGVAILATRRGKGELSLHRMAGRALHRRGVVIELVPIQAERGDRVIEANQRICERVELATLVFRVAVVTAFDLLEHGVQAGARLDLKPDRRMAFQAQCSLACFQRLVAESAVLLEFCVRSVSLQDSAGAAHRAERSRTERQSAAAPQRRSQPCKQDYQDHESGNGNNAISALHKSFGAPGQDVEKARLKLLAG
jgi:hypothetical protein